MKRQAGSPIVLELMILVLALAGLAINLLLMVRHLTGGGIAGCGGGSGCEELLNSRWSQMFGLPVTAFGGLAYVALMGSFAANGRRLLGPCLGLIAGAAVWFVFVQAVLVGRFCPWCMTAHAIGAVIVLLGWRHLATDGGMPSATRTIVLSAALAACGIALVQLLGPQPVTHRIGGIGDGGDVRNAAVHARGTGRKVEFDGGRKTYDLSALPHLGREDADRVMVEYFDYSCAACRTMRGYLEALIAKHPDGICVVVLPVPLERSCNHSLAASDAQHPGSCETARHALALWRAKPQAFARYHQTMLDGGSATTARSRALEILPRADLDAAMGDPWIDELLQANITDWLAFSADTRNLPKLLITGKRILHGLPSGEADFIRVMERELGL
jgi:uncharacterized membrane protein